MRNSLILSEAPHGVRVNLDQPDPPAWVILAIRLFNRCALAKEIRLPIEGGVDDQPELIMQMFEIIYQERSLWLEEKRKEIERKAEQERKHRFPLSGLIRRSRR